MSLPFVNDTNNIVPDSLLTTYGIKSIELSVTKDVTNMCQSSLLEKEKILKEEKQKLIELNNQVWSLKDSYCNQVWQFSQEHNFSVIFRYYPFITEIDLCKKWKNNNLNDDVERSSELMDLINEIDAIKAKISNLNREKNIKQDVENALMKLKKLQSISDDAAELLRLINPREYSGGIITPISMPIYDEIIPNHSDKITRRKNDSNCKNLKNKKARDNKGEPLLRNQLHLKDDKLSAAANKKEVTKTPKNYPQLSLQKTIVFSAKTRITNASTELNHDERYKNFTPKKRSDISVRFEQHRDNYNHYYQ
ncbi:uncharacterized protein LOC116844055 [Odontomachus brunneus]|uniref:uncharacterized protein LOC116844055 n=1 Tax=Odontomachus brunneus TaxID=486640 RepID=UPI0013F1F63F|nr:uncharacterized protein LOC116844055 [Odontomachus brunneus]